MTSSVIYLLLQVFDVYLTYLLTPDLRLEANILVSRFNLGWTFVIMSAIATSVAMFAGQFWVWKNLLDRFPDGNQGYRDFYHHILYDRKSSKNNREKPDIKGIILSILLILVYGLLAAKFMVVIWNALFFIFAIRVEAFVQAMLTKNMLASLFGLFMYFVYLYQLYKQQ